MDLKKKELIKLMKEIKKASIDLKSNVLVFTREWLYNLPGQSLEINGERLHENYKIPIGFDGYGVDDPDELVRMGFLSKISEWEGDPVTPEKMIRYRVKELVELKG